MLLLTTSYSQKALLFTLLSVLFCFTSFNLFGQGFQFGYDFAPQEGLVKAIERPQRDEICLNGSWAFKPVSIPSGVSFEEIKSNPLPDDSGWETTPIKIPSPWNVNGFTNGEGGDFRAYPSYPESWNGVKAGWLKKTIEIPADWANNRLILHFEAIAGYCKIFVNGREAGQHFDSFLPISIDITDYATAGESAEVLVWVAHGSLLNDPGRYGRRNYVAGSFWGIFIAGIWQDVYLQKLPLLYIQDSFIQPWVDQDLLEIEVTIKNTTGKSIKFNLDAKVKRWLSLNGKSITELPETNWTLGETKLKFSLSKLQVGPNETKVFKLSTTVNNRLDLWTPDQPNLYGLVLSIEQNKNKLDLDYTRFGWRQFKLNNTELLLNNEPIQIRGDSWHFMGVPQMTRRYAYSWFQMLKDANANGVRLHAQVFPRFYLEMADELGICVLDETAIWSSDGGPKIDSEAYWQACRTHVQGLVLRDRNHPSVMGWSVCNETLPVTKHVFHAPQVLIDRNVEEINNWIAITQATDPTRTWISGDGETQAETNLPTVIGHYGGLNELKRWSGQGKPWGIGETGMAYYGTPAQVAKINGDRAYESFLGRMEGLAGEAFDLIKLQRDNEASFSSIFNLAWYGLKPLPLGMPDIHQAPELDDGIFFKPMAEAKPGYQPERLGPYTSTFNPGYDPTLPLYDPWPLFDAVRAAFSDQYKNLPNYWEIPLNNTVSIKKERNIAGIVWLSAAGSKSQSQFEDLAIKFEPLSTKRQQLIIVDGQNPPPYSEKIEHAIRQGSTLLVWQATGNSAELISKLTGNSINFFNRKATSYLVNNPHELLNGLSNASLYFSEMSKEPTSELSIGGPLLNTAKILLDACQTDWQSWNYQGEAIKTAKVIRSERERQSPTPVIISQTVGNGEILVSTIDFFALGNSGRYITRNMITNLGGSFNGKPGNIPAALNDAMVLQNALMLGSLPITDEDVSMVFKEGPLSDDALSTAGIGTLTQNQYWDIASANEDGIFDFSKFNFKIRENAVVYLSFWLYSPRSLTNLLIEPDMPRLDVHFGVDDALAFNVNGKMVKEIIRQGDYQEDEFMIENIPLEKGWNHVIIKVAQGSGFWKTKLRFSSNKPEFLLELKSAVDR